METSGAYCPQSRRWSLLEMRQMRVRRFREKWRVITTQPASIRTLHLLPSRYSKCLNVFSLRVVAGQFVAPTICNTTASSPPHHATHRHHFLLRDHLVVCCCTYRTTWRPFPEDHYLIPQNFVISPWTRSTPTILKSATVIYYHILPVHTSSSTYVADHC